MQQRFRFTFSGTIAVDDITLRSRILGYQVQLEQGASPLTEAELLQIDEQVLDLFATMNPSMRLYIYLANGPLRGLKERLAKRLRSELAGCEMDCDELSLEEIATPQ